MTEPAEQRYEYRIWGNDLDDVERLIRSSGAALGVQTGTETYFVTPAVDDVNVKARESMLDIKTLVEVTDGFERWTVRLKQAFPVSAAVLSSEVFPLLRLTPPRLGRAEYSLQALIGDIAEQHEQLRAVAVTKQRHQFALDGCTAEAAMVRIGSADAHTVAIESADIDALRGVRSMLGLERHDNVSYPKAIRATLRGEPAG